MLRQLLQLLLLLLFNLNNSVLLPPKISKLLSIGDRVNGYQMSKCKEYVVTVTRSQQLGPYNQRI